jgi:hypothetical protein
MIIFCLLWIPLFYFFRRSFTTGGYGGHAWALLLGCAVVALQFFFSPLVAPGEFGLSRWLSSFVDITGVPVLVPLVVYWLLVALRRFSTNVDYAGFALLWLIPLAAFHTINNSQSSPIMLMVVPLLWTAQSVGIPFFISCMVRYLRWYIMIPSILGIIILPVIAATSWWAFFSHQTLMGFLLFSVSLVPAVVSIVLDFLNQRIEEGIRQ